MLEQNRAHSRGEEIIDILDRAFIDAFVEVDSSGLSPRLFLLISKVRGVASVDFSHTVKKLSQAVIRIWQGQRTPFVGLPSLRLCGGFKKPHDIGDGFAIGGWGWIPQGLPRDDFVDFLFSADDFFANLLYHFFAFFRRHIDEPRNIRREDVRSGSIVVGDFRGCFLGDERDFFGKCSRLLLHIVECLIRFVANRVATAVVVDRFLGFCKSIQQITKST